MPTKDQLRHHFWNLLSEEGVGAFPFPLNGRIPNFKGSVDAARRLAETDIWHLAKSVKANPDAPQLKVRALALDSGKRLFMAVPRLRDEHPFREIVIDDQTKPRKAVSIKGSKHFGQPRAIDDLPQIDLVVAGSVAVNPDGRRLGKGGGFSDIEFALAVEADKITDKTTIVTTVHSLQVTEADIPFEEHDVPVDCIVTPERVIETRTDFQRPNGIDPEMVSKSYREEIPVLTQILEK